MFDEVTDTPTVARTSNLNEELGQVSQCRCNLSSLIISKLEIFISTYHLFVYRADSKIIELNVQYNSS